jgi:hypothetical protein
MLSAVTAPMMPNGGEHLPGSEPESPGWTRPGAIADLFDGLTEAQTVNGNFKLTARHKFREEYL